MSKPYAIQQVHYEHAIRAQPPPPISVVDLFPAERYSLLTLMLGLTDDQWARPTACPGWTVKDVALHVLGVDLGNLSVQRDRFVDAGTAGLATDEWTDLVEFVNRRGSVLGRHCAGDRLHYRLTMRQSRRRPALVETPYRSWGMRIRQGCTGIGAE